MSSFTEVDQLNFVFHCSYYIKSYLEAIVQRRVVKSSFLPRTSLTYNLSKSETSEVKVLTEKFYLSTSESMALKFI